MKFREILRESLQSMNASQTVGADFYLKTNLLLFCVILEREFYKQDLGSLLIKKKEKYW